MGADAAPQVIRVGFGCFHFKPRLAPGDRFRARDYPKAVARALEESAGIDKVHVHSPEGDLTWEHEVVDRIPTLREAGGPFPRPYFFSVCFNVRIPDRIQAEITPRLMAPLLTSGTEEFRVRLSYGYEMPVAVVQPLSTDTRRDPSDGVMLVREFLSRELSRSQQEAIEFESLGPSPMHADFYLMPSVRPADAHGRFWRISHTEPAYHRYEYGYDARAYDGPSQVVDEFHSAALTEMSLLYRLAQEEWVGLEAWAEIDAAVAELVKSLRKRGPLGSFRRTFLSSRVLADAQLALIEFEGRQLTAGAKLNRDVTKRCREPGLIQELLKEEYDDRPSFPSEATADLLRLMENRRQTDRDMLMLALASVLGGALGAVGGLLAG